MYTNPQGRYWLCCPNCGARIKPLLKNTRLQFYPAWCKKCKHESIVDYDGERQSLSARAD